MLPQLSRAREWFLRSGIQETSGGVARYAHTAPHRNLPISTEITGYALSFFVYANAPDAARAAAAFLTEDAWDAHARVMPFEVGPAEYTYFFDCGIIVRGLLAAGLHDVAIGIGESMLNDFTDGAGEYHPILTLPSKSPVARDPMRWSRSTGCYQLKSAMAWDGLFALTQDAAFRRAYESVLEQSLRTFRSFLPGHAHSHNVMDRLHAFAYFLEGMLVRPAAAELREGIAMLAHHLREIEPEFVRSDVFAQLLRVRSLADQMRLVELDRAPAEWEAAQLAAFQREDGGYWFGRKGDEWLPFVNPVSTAFAAQALEFWCAGPAPLPLLI